MGEEEEVSQERKSGGGGGRLRCRRRCQAGGCCGQCRRRGGDCGKERERCDGMSSKLKPLCVHTLPGGMLAGVQHTIPELSEQS